MTDAEYERLIKLCGMLGSAHDGERAAAALKVSQFLKDRKLTWNDVLKPKPTIVTVTPPSYMRRTWRRVVRELIDDYDTELRERELDFVYSLSERRYPLTERQEKWLRDICDRLEVEEWE